MAPLNPPRTIILALVACPRCHLEHRQMPFARLQRVGDFSHWGTCTIALEPVLLRTTLCTLGACGVLRGRLHDDESHCVGCTTNVVDGLAVRTIAVTCPVHCPFTARIGGRSALGYAVDDSGDNTQAVESTS